MSVEGLALIVGALALVIASLSWWTAIHATRAAIFDLRYAVYSDVRKFVAYWNTHGRTEVRDGLGSLVDAWDRSHFLIHEDVTRAIRVMWIDALNADISHRIVAGKLAGDRDVAIERSFRLTQFHTDYDRLRGYFLPQMRVESGYRPWLRKTRRWGTLVRYQYRTSKRNIRRKLKSTSARLWMNL